MTWKRWAWSVVGVAMVASGCFPAPRQKEDAATGEPDTQIHDTSEAIDTLGADDTADTQEHLDTDVSIDTSDTLAAEDSAQPADTSEPPDTSAPPDTSEAPDTSTADTAPQCPTSCPQPDEPCKVSVCDDSTAGQCVARDGDDGTHCDDGSVCTQTDLCISGACVGSNPLSCSPSGPCYEAQGCSPTAGCLELPRLAGSPCNTSTNQLGSCSNGSCLEPTCSDGWANGTETGIDCGGSCDGCGVGSPCDTPTDCTSGVCAETCSAPTCTDNVKNGDETGVDCGGSCQGCALTESCLQPQDCLSSACVQGTCEVCSSVEDGQLTTNIGVRGVGAGPRLVAASSQNGDIHVFHRGTSGWTQDSIIPGAWSNAEPVDIYGSTVVVGHPTLNVNGWEHAGAVRVFERTEAGWISAGQLNPNPTSGESLGRSVAVSANHLVASRTGKAPRVWSRVAEDWQEDGPVSLISGESCSGVFDIDGDTMVCTAFNASSAEAMIVVLGRGSDGAWSEEQALVPDAGSGTVGTLRTVAIDGDVIAVGDPEYTGQVTDSGAVYIFERDGEGAPWHQEALLEAPNPTVEGWVGSSVAVRGSIVVTSADQGDGEGVGAVEVYRRSTTGWSHTTTLLEPSPAEFSVFGYSVFLADGTVVAASGLSSNGALHTYCVDDGL